MDWEVAQARRKKLLAETFEALPPDAQGVLKWLLSEERKTRNLRGRAINVRRPLREQIRAVCPDSSPQRGDDE